MMTRGTIQGIQVVLGIGFVRPDDGTADLLFGRNDLEAGAFEELREGQWVTFIPAPDPRDPARPEARDLRLLPE